MTDRAVSVQIRDIAGHILSFSSFRSFRQFIDEELAFWDQANSEVGGNTSDLPGFYFLNNLRNLKNQINSWEPSIDTWDEQTFNSQLSRTVQECLSASSTYWIWSNQPFVDTYLQCFRDHGGTSARAFVEYIAQKNTGSISNGDCFKGYMLAYEFLNQKSEILKRRHSEKTAITRLRDQFVESRDQLFGETDALKQDFTNWDEKSRSKSTRRLAAQKRLNRIVVKNNGSTE